MLSLRKFSSNEIMFDRKREPRWIEVRAGYKTPCWIWRGRIMPTGYGMRTKNNKSVYAHTYYFQLFYGILVPPKKQLDHLCRNRPCMRPDHLEIVNNQENSRRGNRTKLNNGLALEMVEYQKQGFTTREIGRLFNVTGGHVSRVMRGIFWGVK